ncbi:MAG TPA: HNH endonuclease signature motif containing protein [Mycobacterium sp.]|nr:HNH endonuclease signature motif containing protein [Mycobacterium sp.]HQC78225.1 HNH endonuclease signature motif containing protein [Mycobacterium sp.]
MRSIVSVLESLDQVVEALGAADLDSLGAADRYAVLERLETSRRRQVAVAGSLVCRLEQFEGCPPVPVALADVLRISRAEARRRIRDAEQLAPRITLTGQPVPPVLPATAKAWEAGLLDIEHLRVIQSFIRDLPGDIPPPAVTAAEEFLAEKAAELRPDQLEKLATRLTLTLNPDGKFSDEDRARKRGFLWCGQRPDGTSVGKLTATPELRSMLDAWFAKFAAPGMCNPDDAISVTDGEPSEEVAARDSRGHAQRQHDALVALIRGQLGDPKLGQHNGLPVTVIVSATLEQLQTGAGHAVTAGGTLLPIPDLIRMASHAWHYLCVFEQHTQRALYLGRSKRIASADQRIMLHARDRGCTAPGCDKPGYHTEVHHNQEWAAGGRTDINDLTLACHSDHKRITPGGWRTRQRRDGRTEWLPPPGLPFNGGTNDYHHPERLLPRDDETA